jgi:hypothetical protein
MMGTSSPPGRRVGRSVTNTSSNGRNVALSDSVDKTYICQKLCDCNEKTDIVDKLGRKLKQRCVTTRIRRDEEFIGQFAWRYKAEVGYFMSRPPKPLMSKENPVRASHFPIGRAIGDALPLRDLEGRWQKGMVRIPDITVLKISGVEIEAMRASGNIDWDRFIPVQRNIHSIIEIKFPGDKLSRGQLRDYPKIAGDGEFIVMTMNDCNCEESKRRKPVKEPVRVPVTTPMKRETEEVSSWRVIPLKPQLVPVPTPRNPQYGPIAQAGSHALPLSDWLKQKSRSLPKAAEYLAVGILAIGIATAAVTLLPVEGAAAVVVLVVAGTTKAGSGGAQKEDTTT